MGLSEDEMRLTKGKTIAEKSRRYVHDINDLFDLAEEIDEQEKERNKLRKLMAKRKDEHERKLNERGKLMPTMIDRARNPGKSEVDICLAVYSGHENLESSRIRAKRFAKKVEAQRFPKLHIQINELQGTGNVIEVVAIYDGANEESIRSAGRAEKWAWRNRDAEE